MPVNHPSRHLRRELQMPPVNSNRKEEKIMTYEAFELVELGQAEALIEASMPEGDEEMWEKYMPGVAPYVEFE
jgi:hypothetical protein